MNNLLILGAGGHGKVVADIARETQQWKQICFLDDHVVSNTFMEVLGTFKDLVNFKGKFSDVVIAIGKNKLRAELLTQAKNLGFNLATLIHPKTCISSSVKIGIGSVVMPGVVINSCAQIGMGVIINTSSVIEHDCVIDDYVHISPSVSLIGGTKVGEYSWICVGAATINNIVIGKNTIVGAGAVVIKNIPDNVLAVGVPAKIIKSL